MTKPVTGTYILFQDDQHNTTQERGTPQYKVCLSKIVLEGAFDQNEDQGKLVVMMRLMVPLMIMVMIMTYKDQGILSLTGGDDYMIYEYVIYEYEIYEFITYEYIIYEYEIYEYMIYEYIIYNISLTGGDEADNPLSPSRQFWQVFKHSYI